MLSLYQQRVLVACKCHLSIRQKTSKNTVMLSASTCMHMIFFQAVWYSTVRPPPVFGKTFEAMITQASNLVIFKQWVDDFIQYTILCLLLIPLLKKISLDQYIFNNFKPISNLVYLSKLLKKALLLGCTMTWLTMIWMRNYNFHTEKFTVVKQHGHVYMMTFWRPLMTTKCITY